MGKKGKVRVFFRAGRYQSRPSHWDPLHCEIRAGKKNLVVDPGTYKYNDPKRLWKNSLAFSECHNGPQEISKPFSNRKGPFLWTKWPYAELGYCGLRGNRVVLTGKSDDGFVREINIQKEKVQIRDLNQKSNRLWLTRWTTPKGKRHSIFVEKGNSKIKNAQLNKSIGWASTYYGKKTACSVIEVYENTKSPHEIITSFH